MKKNQFSKIPTCAVLAVFLFLGANAPSFAQDSVPPFDAGLQAFHSGDYPLAARQFQLSLDRDGPSAAAYFNLGLSQEKSGEVASAVLSFLRANALDPSLREVSAALNSLRKNNKLAIPVEGKQQDFIRRFGGVAPWAFGAVLFWAGAFLVVSAFWGEKTAAFPAWFGAALFLSGTGLLAWTSAADPLVADRELAVLVAPQPVPLQVNPVDHAGAIETLRPGSVLRVHSRRGKWVYASLPGGKKGWIATETLVSVIPPSEKS